MEDIKAQYERWITLKLGGYKPYDREGEPIIVLGRMRRIGENWPDDAPLFLRSDIGADDVIEIRKASILAITYKQISPHVRQSFEGEDVDKWHALYKVRIHLSNGCKIKKKIWLETDGEGGMLEAMNFCEEQ
jgi:hypothetical protein